MRATTYSFTMMLMVGVVMVDAASIDADMTEVIEARTEGGGENTIVVTVVTQGRLPMMLCPYFEKPIGLGD